jgi:POTRA domain, FtsQ-type
MKRKTSKHRRSYQSVLQARVITRRTVWFGFLKISGKLVKLACILALLTGAGWGVWRGIEHAFYKNPDFQLKVIDLNSNPAISEMGIVAVAGINLESAPNLFSIDIKEVTRKLNALPEITEARVERHPPGTLHVRVIPRAPAAWITDPGTGVSGIRKTGSLLVDREGAVFACPPLLTEAAMELPVIMLPKQEEGAIQPGRTVELPELEHAFLLLEAARDADAECLRWIDSVRQPNAWSLLVTTRDGTEATFSLGDHEPQIARLRAAVNHAAEKGYHLATINLIPKYNVPITLREEPAPPKARPVTPEMVPPSRNRRRSNDLDHILNRN